MHDVLNAFFKKHRLDVSNMIDDQEASNYFGCSFQIGAHSIKYRKAKVTPKKNGLFVTLWKRNAQLETEPFHASDKFDFYLVAVEVDEKSGLFCFPKEALALHGILSTSKKLGKRGFRVYPSFTKVDSSQAQSTQSWQLKYFKELSANPSSDSDQIVSMLLV